MASGINVVTHTTSKGKLVQNFKKYLIVFSLMNTYDEAAQQEFGTHQEFWFQFFYNFELTSRGTKTNPAISASTTSFEHFNYPNILFNAFEVTSVTFECGNTNLYNSNLCQ